MFIHITDPADQGRILLNAACILMVRSAVQEGSIVYLSTGAVHHPDVLRAVETPDEILALLSAAGLAAPVSPAEAAAATRSGASERPAH